MESSAPQKWSVNSHSIAAMVCAVVMLAALFFLEHEYATSYSKLESHPSVFDVSQRLDYDARVAFGKSPLCTPDRLEVGGSDELRECWIAESYDATAWTMLPSAHLDIRLLSNYQRGLQEGFVYYRFVLPVPAQLAAGKHLAFSPAVVSHDRFEAFVDGESVMEGRGVSAAGSAAVIPLPLASLKDGQAVVVIKATLGPSDTGIAHLGGFMVGPAHVLSAFDVAVEHEMVTYFLLFILSKGSIWIVFALMYLLTERTRDLGTFLAFSWFSTLGHVLASDLLVAVVPFNLQVTLFFLVRGAAAVALLWFFLARFGGSSSARSRLVWVVVSCLLLAAALASGLDYGWGSHSLSIVELYRLSHLIYWAVVATGFGLALRQGRTKQSATVPRRQLWLAGAVGLYLCALTWDFFVVTFDGHEAMATFDLLFFFAVAADVAAGFGAKERLLRLREEDLARARVDQAVAHTVRTLAHDVRSPLCSAQMVLEILDSEADPEAFRALKERMLPRLQHSIATVDSMIEDVLAASAPGTAEVQPLSVVELLEETLVDTLWPRPETNVTIAWDFRHRHLVAVDGHKIKRALANVIENAVDATGQGGRIWIMTTTVDDASRSFVKVTVGNTGSYIAPESLNRVFEVFYTNGKAKGTGLGLSIAHKIVTLHGGKIWCESQRDRGTEFHLTLPRYDEPDRHLGASLPQHSRDVHNRPTKGRRIASVRAMGSPTV